MLSLSGFKGTKSVSTAIAKASLVLSSLYLETSSTNTLKFIEDIS